MSHNVLHLCHSYKAPFTECARQYVALFKNSPYKITTVFLIGEADDEIESYVGGDEVIFLGFGRDDLKGFKLRIIKALREKFAGKEFAFCIAHRSKPTWIATVATNLPIISVHHSFDDYQRFNKRWFINFFRRRLMLIGVSDAVRDELRSRFPKWPKDRIETLHNRIDYASLSHEQLTKKLSRRTLNLPDDAWVFANVGRLHPMKDQATLIRAFAIAKPYLTPNTILVILGEGKLENKLRKLAEELGIQENVQFLNFVVNARNYFKAFDCFVLSSNHEPFGMVLLEAMTANIQVISSDSGGAAEVIEGVGKTFTTGDYNQLALLMRECQKSSPAMSLESAMRTQLESKFSDNAARQQFWQLPRLKTLINKQHQ